MIFIFRSSYIRNSGELGDRSSCIVTEPPKDKSNWCSCLVTLSKRILQWIYPKIKPFLKFELLVPVILVQKLGMFPKILISKIKVFENINSAFMAILLKSMTWDKFYPNLQWKKQNPYILLLRGKISDAMGSQLWNFPCRRARCGYYEEHKKIIVFG